MKRRVLGRTGIHVSEIAFGCVEIGMPYGIGVKDKDDMLPEKEAIILLNEALEKGINFYDTARLYGTSEHLLGKAFKNKREKIVISTKCVHLKEKQKEANSTEVIKREIENSINDSLKALDTNYVDVFMLHDGTMDILENPDILDVFVNIKKSGRTRAIGVSTYDVHETQKVLNDADIWDIVQTPFNLLDQRQGELFKIAKMKGVGVIVRSVLFRGFLSGRGENMHPKLKGVEDHIKRYYQFLSKDIDSLPALAVKFALSAGDISSVLIGIDRKEYLNQAVQFADGKYLDNQLLDTLKGLSYPDSEFLNLHTWDKMGWLK